MQEFWIASDVSILTDNNGEKCPRCSKVCIKSDEKSWKFFSCIDFLSFTSLTGMCIFINQKSSKGDENGNLKRLVYGLAAFQKYKNWPIILIYCIYFKQNQIIYYI